MHHGKYRKQNTSDKKKRHYSRVLFLPKQLKEQRWNKCPMIGRICNNYNSKSQGCSHISTHWRQEQIYIGNAIPP